MFASRSIYKLVDVLVKNMGGAYPEISSARGRIKDVIKSEEENFNQTLDRGLEIFADVAAQVEKSGKQDYSRRRCFQTL